MPVPQAATIGTIWIRFESLQARRLSGRQARPHGGGSMGEYASSGGSGVSRGVMGSWGSAYLQIGLLELSRVEWTRSRSEQSCGKNRFITDLFFGGSRHGNAPNSPTWWPKDFPTVGYV